MAKTSTTRTTATPSHQGPRPSSRDAAPKDTATKAEVVEILLDTQKKLLESEAALAARGETIRTLEAELAAARAEADRFETAAYDVQVEIRILEGARDAARARLAEARAEVLELTRMLAALQEGQQQAEDRLANLAEEIAETGQLNTLKETVERQEQHLATRDREMAELSRLLSEAEARAGDSAAVLHHANAWIAPLLEPFLTHPSGTPFSDEDYAEYAARIVASGAFDPDWYRTTNPDVAESGTDPALHFLQYGLAEGRAPRDLSAPRILPDAG